MLIRLLLCFGVFISALSGCATVHTPNPAPLIFETTITGKVWHFPLPVRVKEGGVLYTDPTWAIRIISVTANGIRMKEQSGFISYYVAPKLKTIKPESKNHIYYLIKLFTINEHNNYITQKFHIWPKTKFVEIKYTFSYADGSRSPDIYTLKATIHN